MHRIRIAYFLALCLMMSLVSCGKTTSSDKGVVAGKITLDGQTDNSGVLVSIYLAGVVPEKVHSINNDYPQVAFQVTDKVCFDHRSFTPLATTTTNQEGKFSFGELPYDKYIIAYNKEGWGYNYIFDFVLNQSDLDISTTYDLKLYHEQEIPAYLDGAYTFESGKCYVSESNVVFGENAQITMQNNTRILLGQNVKISSYGVLTSPAGESWAHITSLTGIYTGNASPTQLAEGLSILGGTNSVHNISFSYLSNALMVKSANQIINKTSFRSCILGLTANTTSDFTLSSSLFINNQDVNGSACYLYNVARVSIEKCLYHGNYISLRHELVKDAVVEDNAIIDSERGFLNLWESTAIFQHNEISSEGIGIENSGRSNLDIRYSNILAKTCVKLYHTVNWYNLPNLGWTRGNYNNFQSTMYSIQAEARYYNNGQPFPLDFSNNYFNTTSQDEINDLVYDVNDFPDPYVGSDGAVVNYLPYKMSKVAIAGIQ